MKAWLYVGAGFALAVVTAAHAGTVRETIDGVIGGKHTKDVQGFFGQRGADLKGKPFTITLLYRSQDFNQNGKCRNNSCDYYTASGTAAVAKSVRISVTVGGATQAYTPTNIAALFLSISGTPYFAIDSDAYSGFGGYGPHGVQIYVDLMSNPQFGAALSPGDPVLNHKTAVDNVLFFDESSQTAVEQLDLNVGYSAPKKILVEQDGAD